MVDLLFIEAALGDHVHGDRLPLQPAACVHTGRVRP
jgi:hypothetical protein